MKPYSDCTASAGTTGLTSGPGFPPLAPAAQLVECDDRLHALVDPLYVGDRRGPERVADDRHAPRAPGRRGAPVAAAVEHAPERVEGVHRLSQACGSGRRFRRRQEEVERVPRAVDEVRVLLGRHAGAAELLAVPRLGERVAERHRVHLVVLVRQRLRRSLPLDVIGHDDVSPFGEILGEPPVHALGALDRAGRDHHARVWAPQAAPGVGVARAGQRCEHAPPDQRSVTVRVRDRKAQTARPAPAPSAADCRRSSPGNTLPGVSASRVGVAACCANWFTQTSLCSA